MQKRTSSAGRAYVRALLAIMVLVLIPASRLASGAEIIDVHEHIALDLDETAGLVNLMDRAGVSTMFLLDTPAVTFEGEGGFTGYDDTVRRQLAMKREYPGRFRVFYTFPPWDSDGPRKACALARDGIDGLKFYNGVMWKDLGAIDSPAMYAAYQAARECHLPVTIHVEALNPVQRRQFERVLADFAGVTFVCPHLCGVENSLEVLDSMLRRNANLYTDAGPWHRVGAFAIAHPEKFRAFYIAHSGRIMFATDSVKDELDEDPPLDECIECERELLAAKYFSCFGAGVLSGLFLPRGALEDIYHRTAEKVYGIPARPLLPVAIREANDSSSPAVMQRGHHGH